MRRRFGITGFSANAYSGREVGDHVIEPHDEASPGSGRHEELYVVLSGVADFTVGEESLSAPAGSLRLRPARRATARRSRPRRGRRSWWSAGGPATRCPVSPFEHWYAAQPAYDAGDYATATAIASDGLQDYPEHGALRYQLACYAALAGDRAAALEHLRIAFAADPRTREWAARRPRSGRRPRRSGLSGLTPSPSAAAGARVSR